MQSLRKQLAVLLIVGVSIAVIEPISSAGMENTASAGIPATSAPASAEPAQTMAPSPAGTQTVASMPTGTQTVASVPAGTQTMAPAPTGTPVVSAAPTTEPTPGKVVRKGLTKGKDGSWYYYKKGKPLKNCWKVVKGKKYYFTNNGTAAVKSNKIDGEYYIFDKKGRLIIPKKKSLVRVGKTAFYLDEKGKPVQGWAVLNKKLYYVYKNGKCAANKTIDKVKFTAEGYAKDNCVSQLKMKAMEIVKKIIKPGMSKAMQLKRCWYYIGGITFKPFIRPDETKKYWQYQCALDTFNKGYANCYGKSRAFAALAKEIGYTPYVIMIPNIHCWVRINGRYWDNMGNRMGTVKSGKKYKKSQVEKF